MYYLVHLLYGLLTIIGLTIIAIGSLGLIFIYIYMVSYMAGKALKIYSLRPLARPQDIKRVEDTRLTDCIVEDYILPNRRGIWF